MRKDQGYNGLFPARVCRWMDGSSFYIYLFPSLLIGCSLFEFFFLLYRSVDGLNSLLPSRFFYFRLKLNDKRSWIWLQTFWLADDKQWTHQDTVLLFSSRVGRSKVKYMPSKNLTGWWLYTLWKKKPQASSRCCFQGWWWSKRTLASTIIPLQVLQFLLFLWWLFRSG